MRLSIVVQKHHGFQPLYSKAKHFKTFLKPKIARLNRKRNVEFGGTLLLMKVTIVQL